MTTRTPGGRPRVLIPACSQRFADHPFQSVGEKYIRAIQLAGCDPLILPSARGFVLEDFVELADGLLLSGSPSNVDPVHFGQTVLDPSLPLDPRRDAHSLPLVRMSIDKGLPLLAICRGLQELNVALGGSLHQAVHLLPGRRDHRALEGLPEDLAYASAHRVQLRPGGRLTAMLTDQSFSVNSLHGQAIDRIAAGLRVEAVSEDGVIEACSVSGAQGFAIGVQWHPEWNAEQDPVSMRLLTAFGDACRAYRDRSGCPSRTASQTE